MIKFVNNAKIELNKDHENSNVREIPPNLIVYENIDNQMKVVAQLLSHQFTRADILHDTHTGNRCSNYEKFLKNLGWKKDIFTFDEFKTISDEFNQEEPNNLMSLATKKLKDAGGQILYWSGPYDRARDNMVLKNNLDSLGCGEACRGDPLPIYTGPGAGPGWEITESLLNVNRLHI